MVTTLARPLESVHALRDATHHNIPSPAPNSLEPAIAVSCDDFPTGPGSHAHTPRLLGVDHVLLDSTSDVVRPHVALLASAYGTDSLPQVIATQPSTGDIQTQAEAEHEHCVVKGLKSPGVKLDEFGDMKVSTRLALALGLAVLGDTDA